MRQLGGSPTEDQVTAMHPLRARETAGDGGAAKGEPKPMTGAEQAMFDELTGG